MGYYIEEYLSKFNSNNNANPYDFAVAGIPFLNAASKDYPYIRESLDSNKQQFDTAPEVGEQKLGNWWYRSQSSFDLGAGAKFTDTAKDEKIARRFLDSGGVDAITVPGEVTLLNKMLPIFEVPGSYASEGHIDAFTADATSETFPITMQSIIATGGSGTGASFFVSSTYNEDTGFYDLYFVLNNSGINYQVNDELEVTIGTTTVLIIVTSVSDPVVDAQEEIIKTINFKDTVLSFTEKVIYFPGDIGYEPIDIYQLYGSTILDVDANASDIYVLTTVAIYKFDTSGVVAPIPGQKIMALQLKDEIDDSEIIPPSEISSGKLAYIKDRIVFAVDTGERTYIFQAAPTSIGEVKKFTPTAISWANTTKRADGTTKYAKGVKYTFAEKHGWKKGEKIAEVSGSKVQQFNFDAAKKIIWVSKDGLSIRVASNILPTTPYTTKTIDKDKAAEIRVEYANKPVEIYDTASLANITSIAEGPRGVYFTASTENKSVTLFSTIGVEEQNDIPKLRAPIVVAELPAGEIIFTSIAYLGTYLILGTSRGVRVCIIDSQGSLIVGPLSIKSDFPVTSLAVDDEFCYANGAEVKNWENLNDNPSIAYRSYQGVYKLNLSKTTEDNSLFFAYQKHSYPDSRPYSDTDANLLYNKNVGVVVINAYPEDSPYATFNYKAKGEVVLTSMIEVFTSNYIKEKVETGWLQTGRIRLDTAESKVFQYLRVDNVKSYGNIAVEWCDEADKDYIDSGFNEIARWDTYANKYAELPGAQNYIDGVATAMSSHQYISYKFVLRRGNPEEYNIDPDSGWYDDPIKQSPVLLSYQVKANPSNIKQTLIRLPLIAVQKERGLSGNIIERPVFDRLSVLENAEQAGQVVLFQDFGTGEERRVIIDKTQFISNHIPESTVASDRGGIILLTLRTVDISSTDYWDWGQYN